MSHLVEWVASGDAMACKRCGARYSPGEHQLHHVCDLPTVGGRSLRLHDDTKDHWPMYSRGYSGVSVPGLASYICNLPPAFLDELLDAIGVTR